MPCIKKTFLKKNSNNKTKKKKKLKNNYLMPQTIKMQVNWNKMNICTCSLTLEVAIVTKVNFLLTISIDCHEQSL